jgi:hypothetical protein
MNYFLYFAYFLLSPSLAIRVGCFENATFSGISLGLWLNKTNDCHFCNCYMLTTNSSAFNCYKNVVNNTDCLIFSNYSSATGGVELVTAEVQNLPQNQKFHPPPPGENFFQKFPQVVLSWPLTDQLNLTQNRSKNTW